MQNQPGRNQSRQIMRDRKDAMAKLAVRRCSNARMRVWSGSFAFKHIRRRCKPLIGRDARIKARLGPGKVTSIAGQDRILERL